MKSSVYGEFTSAEAIIEAARELRANGYRDMESFTPYPLPELDSVLGLERTRIPWFALAAALSGAAGAFAIIYYADAVAYPVDVGGRPLNSWPADIPIMFETAVLLGALTTFTLVLVLSGLPRLYAPVFEVPGIERASTDRYFLRVPGAEAELHEELRELGAVATHLFPRTGGAS